MSAANLDLSLAGQHYENFPVAPFFLPHRLRRPLQTIYAFARQADDIADEGTLPSDIRLAQLESYQAELTKIKNGEQPLSCLFSAIAHLVENGLPLEPFESLLLAFMQDVHQSSYPDFTSLLAYCEHSANPVGRLVLVLLKADTIENRILSDNICTALQLINFAQDIISDWTERQRCYIPENVLKREGYCANDFLTAPQSVMLSRKFLLSEAKKRLVEGFPLGKKVGGLSGLYLRAIIEGGVRVVIKLSQTTDPQAICHLGKFDILRIAYASIFHRSQLSAIMP